MGVPVASLAAQRRVEGVGAIVAAGDRQGVCGAVLDVAMVLVVVRLLLQSGRGQVQAREEDVPYRKPGRHLAINRAWDAGEEIRQVERLLAEQWEERKRGGAVSARNDGSAMEAEEWHRPAREIKGEGGRRENKQSEW